MAIGDDSPQNKLIDKIKEADLLVALVSISFINEKKPELTKQGLLLNSNRNLIKMAIKLRPCREKDIDQLKEFQWEPGDFDEENNRKPLSIYDENKQEFIISTIAGTLANKVYELKR